MANLKEVRDRIGSVNSTRQITSAMKLVSAAKLKRAQDAVTGIRPYAQKMTEILANVSASLDPSENVFSEKREPNKVLYITITSNKGLCGSFNSHLNKKVKAEIENSDAESAEFSAIGKKAYEYFGKLHVLTSGKGIPVESNEILDNISFEIVAEFAEKIMKAYENGEFDRVYVAYNQFVNAATQKPVVEQYLPVVPPEKKEGASGSVDYIYEPDKKQILEELIPNSLKTQLFKAVLDSNAAEHGARMTAMHQATENATDLLKELKLSYNKARQAAITTEILEITSGAEALASGS